MKKRARRDEYRAKRGTYGGMCLCPCEGTKLAPMATYDPEDPFYSGDRTRKRSRRDEPPFWKIVFVGGRYRVVESRRGEHLATDPENREQAERIAARLNGEKPGGDRTRKRSARDAKKYEVTIEGLRVSISWHPKAIRYREGRNVGNGLWVATVHAKTGSGTLPGGSGISPYEAEQNTRKLLKGSRASNDRTRGRRAARSCGWGGKLSGVSRSRDWRPSAKARKVYARGRRLIGVIEPKASGNVSWRSSVTKDAGVTTGLDKALGILLREAKIKAHPSEFERVDGAYLL